MLSCLSLSLFTMSLSKHCFECLCIWFANVWVEGFLKWDLNYFQRIKKKKKFWSCESLAMSSDGCFFHFHDELLLEFFFKVIYVEILSFFSSTNISLANSSWIKRTWTSNNCHMLKNYDVEFDGLVIFNFLFPLFYEDNSEILFKKCFK